MTPENERLVRRSWQQFEPMAESLAAFFYEKLFELDPDARSLFARTDMEAQGRKVMHMFAEIVRTLDQPEQLVAEVADLGRRHVGYGVRDDQYGSVGTALLWTLECGLGSAFTPEVRDAWTEAYLLCASIVRRGAAQVTG
ncbi:MAG: globin family protein [Gemmatimonadales bacterium]|jgi:hemoglobin-like flavoprotein